MPPVSTSLVLLTTFHVYTTLNTKIAQHKMGGGGYGKWEGVGVGVELPPLPPLEKNLHDIHV